VQAGLNQGLLLAQQARSDNPRALNYLILMSDGVANVDATDPFAILDHAGAQEAQSPIRIVTLGVGISNYNDYLLEQLAQHGNGWYRYLNSPQQARQLFRESWTDLATPFADQARAQVTWDQDAVTSWRIIGYENRLVPDRHFQQDLREFAEVPSGTSVTVFYELDLDPRTRPGDRLGSLDLRWVTPMTGNRMQQDHQVNHQREASRHSQPRLRLGAIIALAADRYAALHHQDVLSHRQVGQQLQDLQGQLQDLEESLHHLDSYHDLEFLLDHLAQYAPYTPHWPKDTPEEPVIWPPSGYAP
jgi:Ca-activated chloride channel family protein